MLQQLVIEWAPDLAATRISLARVQPEASTGILRPSRAARIRRCRRVDRAVRSQSHTSRATGGALLAWLPYEKRTFKLLPTIYDTVACGLRLE